MLHKIDCFHFGGENRSVWVSFLNMLTRACFSLKWSDFTSKARNNTKVNSEIIKHKKSFV